VLGVNDLQTYIIGTILIILLPGPNSIYVLSTAARAGVGKGYRAALGVFTGDFVLMALSAGGVASLLKANPLLFDIVKYAGAAYLFWLAVGLLRAAWAMWVTRREPPATIAEQVPAPSEESPVRGTAVSAQPAESLERPYTRALIISLLNPKAILFFVAFFVQFIDPAAGNPLVSFLVLMVIAQIVSATYLSVLIFGGSTLAAAFRRRRRISAAATSGIGAVFIGFAVKLSLSSAH
jgi:leucine efflux protein